MINFQFKSQLEYGKYGGNICTPVCCIVGSTYLLMDGHLCHNHIDYIFSPEKMDSIMKVCHNMYSECFSVSGMNMMLLEVQKYFPATIEFCEIAGMTQTGRAESVEGLVVQPLCELMASELKKEASRVIIITCLDHTVCYLLDGMGHLLLFDPLEASIREVTSWPFSRDAEYSGLILTRKPL